MGKKVLFKVVDAHRRSIVIGNFGRLDADIVTKLSNIYSIGEVVKAKNKTYGIFCFTNYDAAVEMAEANSFRSPQIIEVEIAGKKIKTPEMVVNLVLCSRASDVIERSKYIKSSGMALSWSVPEHTVCYSAVKVLT